MIWSPAEMRAFRRTRAYRKSRFLMAIFGWWMHLPIVGVGSVFWWGVMDEGLRSTIKPRWGLLTFHFLNDGMRPTLWHTWMQVVSHGRYDGIYPDGAPRNRAEAEAVIERRAA